MKKRFIALTLALFLTLTLFAACGGDSPYASARVGDVISFGGYDWRVLDIQDGKALLLSDLVIGYRAYHDAYEDITWEDSDIRSYLNGEFYNSFSADDRARIAETRVVNNDNPWFDNTPGGDDTTDRIFLLSIEEMVRYFGDSGELARGSGERISGPRRFMGYTYYSWERHTIRDEYSEDRIAYDADGESDAYWLRSPGGYEIQIAHVMAGGILDLFGTHADLGTASSNASRRDPYGVRPAMWLEL